jgi:hypothetical protein
MILDAQMQFSDTQTVTASAVATNVIDLSSDRSIGTGEPMAVVFCIESDAVQSGGDEDYTFDVEYASNAAQSTGRQLVGRRIFESGTPTAPAQNADLLVTGFKFYVPLPPTVLSESERYLGVRYTTAGAAADVDVSAFLVPMRMCESLPLYPNGYTIS